MISYKGVWVDAIKNMPGVHHVSFIAAKATARYTGSMSLPVGIALGSNLGDCSAELDEGVDFVASLGFPRHFREGPRIHTHPVDCPPGSPNYLNTVVEIELDPTHVSPRQLLHRLQSFEQRHGRPADHGVNTPRTIDLDILYYGDLVINEPGLVIPHPRAHLRRFVLEPLFYLRPELILPGQTKTVEQLLETLKP